MVGCSLESECLKTRQHDEERHVSLSLVRSLRFVNKVMPRRCGQVAMAGQCQRRRAGSLYTTMARYVWEALLMVEKVGRRGDWTGSVHRRHGGQECLSRRDLRKDISLYPAKPTCAQRRCSWCVGMFCEVVDICKCETPKRIADAEHISLDIVGGVSEILFDGWQRAIDQRCGPVSGHGECSPLALLNDAHPARVQKMIRRQALCDDGN